MGRLKQFGLFFTGLYRDRRMIMELTRRDFRAQYLGSHLGMLWAFVHPLVTISIIFFVFQIGFKTTPVSGTPFILWLITGMVPWFFLSDGLTKGALSVASQPFLVQKIVFRVSVLPLIRIMSSLIAHLFLVMATLVLFLFYGRAPDAAGLQIVYYITAAFILMAGLSWLLSSVTVFFPDTGNIIQIALQAGFWLTPIFWNIDIIPEKWRTFIMLNPAYYIVEGFRDSLINGVWFWERGLLTLYFWGVTLLLFAIGAEVFRRLRPHFADVL